MQERQVKIVPKVEMSYSKTILSSLTSGTVDGENVQGLNGISYVVEVGAGRFTRKRNKLSSVKNLRKVLMSM